MTLSPEVAALVGVSVGGLLGFATQYADRSRVRRHRRRARLHAAAIEMIAAGGTTWFVFAGARRAGNVDAAMSGLHTGLERLLAAHGTIALEGDAQLREASDRLLGAVSELIGLSEGQPAPLWRRMFGRAPLSDDTERLAELSAAMDALRDAARPTGSRLSRAR